MMAAFATYCAKEYKTSYELKTTYKNLLELRIKYGTPRTKIPEQIINYLPELQLARGLEKKQVQTAIDGNTGLQDFTKSFKERVNATITQENKATPQNLQNRRFDSLSRLIAYNSQCSAVCFDGEKILVAFNEQHHENSNSESELTTAMLKHKDAVFSYLKDYAEYARLSMGDQREKFLQEKNLSERRRNLLLDAAGHYYSDHKDFNDNKGTLQLYLKGLDDREKSKDIIDKSKADKLAGAAFKAREDLRKLEDGLTPSMDEKKQFHPNIIAAFKEQPHLVLDGPFDEKAHAEMRIVDYLKQRSKYPNNKLNKETNIYIGLSKLSCVSCNVAINNKIYDETNKKIDINNLEFTFAGSDGKQHKVEINTRGGHGKGFEWDLVNSIGKDDEKLSAFLGEDAHKEYKELLEKDKKNGKELANTALYGVVRHIASGELKIKGKKVEILPKVMKEINKPEKPSFRSQQPDYSDSESEDTNEARNALLSSGTSNASTIAAQAQPTVSQTLTEFEKQKAEFEAQKAEFAEALRKQSEKLKTVQEENAQLEKINNNLKDNARKKDAMVETLENINIQLKVAHTTLKNELGKANKQHEEEKEASQTKLTEARTEITQKDTENVELKEQLKVKTAGLEEANKQLEEKTTETGKLKEALEYQKKVLKETEAELTASKQNKTTLEKQVTSLTKELEERAEKETKLTEERDKLKEQLGNNKNFYSGLPNAPLISISHVLSPSSNSSEKEDSSRPLSKNNTLFSSISSDDEADISSNENETQSKSKRQRNRATKSVPGKKTEKIVRDTYPSSGDDSGIEGDTEEPKNKSNKRAASRSPSLSGDSSETESKSPNRAKKKQKALKTSKLSSSEDRSSSIFSSEHSSSDSSASSDSSEEKPKAKTKPSKTKTKAKKKRKKIGDESSDPDWSSSSNHLTRTEKENLTHLMPQGELNEKGKYNLNDRLAAVNDNQVLLNKLDKEAVITANINFKAIDAKKSVEAEKIGTVEVRAEHDHSMEHGSNNQALIAEIQAGKIDKNTVIAIERKQYGENQGMKDIIKIASILEHNEKYPNSPLKLPEKLENTLIFQDALLYKAAKENGIKVISLEGRNLEHT